MSAGTALAASAALRQGALAGADIAVFAFEFQDVDFPVDCRQLASAAGRAAQQVFRTFFDRCLDIDLRMAGFTAQVIIGHGLRVSFQKPGSGSGPPSSTVNWSPGCSGTRIGGHSLPLA
jgi:hypothetical protein